MHSFEIRTALDLLNAAEGTFEDYLNDGASSRKAVAAAMLCWHVGDWIYAESRSLQDRFRGKAGFHKSITARCSSLQIMQDITNGTKHKDLRAPRAGMVLTKRREAGFSLHFSRGFDRTELTIHLENGSYTAFDIECRKALIFWREIICAGGGDSLADDISGA